MRFRKQPIEIEAEQFFRDRVPWPEGIRTDLDGGKGNNVPQIMTLEGPLNVSEGDWIITGVAGERYPCKDSIFRATYMPVNPTPEQLLAMGPFTGPASFDVPVEVEQL